MSSPFGEFLLYSAASSWRILDTSARTIYLGLMFVGGLLLRSRAIRIFDSLNPGWCVTFCLVFMVLPSSTTHLGSWTWIHSVGDGDGLLSRL